jgi:hypothetical protein
MEERELIAELRARGLIAHGPDIASGDAHTDRPWFVSLLLGTAGWVAGIFILVIAFMLFKFDSGGGAFVAGIVLMAAAWGLFKVDREGAFVSQLALALSIAGQFATVFGLADTVFRSSHDDVAGVAFVALVLQLALVGIMPNALHRTMSAFFACTAWAIVVRYGLWDRGELSFTRSVGNEPSVGLALAGWALAWVPVGMALYLAVRREPTWMARGWQTIVRPAATGLIVGLAVTTLLSQPFDSFPWLDSQVGRGGFSIWPLLSALAAIAALVAAFALGSRGLTALCVIAALVHVTHFYYAMGASLLLKSVTMLALGALFTWMARRYGPGREAP